jgi:hypothetical protein
MRKRAQFDLLKILINTLIFLPMNLVEAFIVIAPIKYYYAHYFHIAEKNKTF